MERFLKYLESQELKRLDEVTNRLDDASSEFLHFAINPAKLKIDVATRDKAAQLIVVRGAEAGDVEINLKEGAQLKFVEVLFEGSKSAGQITLGDNSQMNATILEVEQSSVDYAVSLRGRGANTRINMLQLVSSDDRSIINLRIAHEVADCNSRSLSKCVAAGNGCGEFHGLIYVAPDAQRTLAEQNSRNVALSDGARIVAEPQLEIYADDVKCTHGATVGQMNSDAILYMRQRGLSESQARKVQLEGFVSDVTRQCTIESLCEVLSELVTERLGRL